MKHCLKCEHLCLDLGSPSYGEYTPGGPGSVSCCKGHFDHGYDEVWKARRNMNTAAETCPDYKEEK